MGEQAFAKELAQAIGTEVGISLGGVVVYCRVMDARVSYGLRQYCVTPTAGTGVVWVDAARCRGVQR